MKINFTFFIILAAVVLISQNNFSQNIKMNEIFPRGTAGNLDWIEIYNSSSVAINIGGYKIYDSGGRNGTKPKKLFPTGTVVPAYGYTVIITDTADFVGDLSGFGLSSNGEWVWLEDTSGVVIDSVLFSATATVNESYGRAPDGGPWKLLSTVTRGKSNVVLTDLLLPQYIQGVNGTNNNRTPFVFRIRIDNLLSNATYRFINQIVTAADGPTTSGAGNPIFVNPDSSITRSTSTSLSTAGQYSEFTTDDNGSYTGWFISEPTGNARFTPGNTVFMRIRMNDGAGGTVAVNWVTTDSVKVINYGNAIDPLQGSGIFGNSYADAKDFIFLYDNVDGTGRPISGAIAEIDGLSLKPVTSYVPFYRDFVDTVSGAWGTIIPNQLPNGIRRIERRVFGTGEIFEVVNTDEDGVWPSGANTVNPSVGLIPIEIKDTDGPVPVELTSFSANIIEGKVQLEWTTATETNNLGFEVQRKDKQSFVKIGFVPGKINSTSIQNYSYVDDNAVNGKYSYRIKQIDLDGSSNYSDVVEVDLSLPVEFSLSQNYPNPFNPSTTISYQIGKQSLVTLVVYNILGKEVATLVNEVKSPGAYNLKFDGTNLSSGIYFYKLTADGFTSTKKFTLMK